MSEPLRPDAIRHHLLVLVVAVDESEIDSTAGVMGHIEKLVADDPAVLQVAVIAQTGHDVMQFQDDGQRLADVLRPPNPLDAGTTRTPSGWGTVKPLALVDRNPGIRPW